MITVAGPEPMPDPPRRVRPNPEVNDHQRERCDLDRGESAPALGDLPS
jgi:hypothetical protein